MSETATLALDIAGRTPRRVLRPASLDELRQLVADQDGFTLMPVGGGGHLGLGLAPAEVFDALLLRDALTGPIQHQEDDLTVVAPAGRTLGEINSVLQDRGQRLPIDPPNAPATTLGGALATALAGPLRTRFGPPRDLVLGMTTLRADGEIVRAGGRVVKNVTGYDLMRLWCGSLGTLGIITEAALRVYPLVHTVDLQTPLASIDEGAALADRLHRADVRPEFADVIDQGDGPRLAVRVAPAAERAARDVLGARTVEAEPDADYVLSRDLGYGAEDSLLVSISATPSRLNDAIQQVRQLAPTSVVVRPLVPVIRASWRGAALPEAARFAAKIVAIRSLLSDGRGSATVERMPNDWQGEIEPWGVPRAGLDIMLRLKAAYDPEGRFNRGRFAGGI